MALAELVEAANITHYVNKFSDVVVIKSRQIISIFQVSPVCLPTDTLARKNLMSEIVEVAGWGYFDIDDPRSSPILQTVKLPVVEIVNCQNIKQLSHFKFNNGQMCVGGVAGKGKFKPCKLRC